MVYWAQGVISFLISYFLRLTKFSFKIMQNKIEFVDYQITQLLGVRRENFNGNW